jgi:hypothetical protein
MGLGILFWHLYKYNRPEGAWYLVLIFLQTCSSRRGLENEFDLSTNIIAPMGLGILIWHLYKHARHDGAWKMNLTFLQT